MSQKEEILISLTLWRAAARRASAACLRRSALETGVHGAGAGMGGTQYFTHPVACCGSSGICGVSKT